ncbi:MAG: gliding motility-associated C-terminal domain-containing protein [Ferruginibacter sp.]
MAGSATAIQNSAVEIFHAGQFIDGTTLMMGPDHKLYVSNYYQGNKLSVINQPNLAGAACDYVDGGILLTPGTFCRVGLPNNINYPSFVCPTSQNASSNVMICAGQTYTLPSGTIVNAAGVYRDTIRNVAGTCDSIIYVIDVSVYNVSLLNTTAHICPNQTYELPSGATVSIEGIYLDTLRNQASCDSVINTIHLFVDHVSLQNIEAHICPGQVYMLSSGTIVSTAGNYLDTLRSQAGCDSIIKTVHLFVDQVVLRSRDVHICPGEVFMLPSGTVVNAEGIYLDTLRSQASCDSIINTIHLFVDHVSLLNTNISICSNQTYQLPSGIIVNTTGTYVDTLRSQAFCDSIINTIHLVVNNISSTHQVDSIYEGQTYTLPSGEIVSTAGSYQSTLTNSFGCDSVISTVLRLKRSIAACIILKNAFTPNGDGINDYWVLYKYNCFKKLVVDVYNRYGSPIYHSDDYKNDWNGKYKNKELPDGTYYYVIKVISFDGKEHVFKGNVTILR